MFTSTHRVAAAGAIAAAALLGVFALSIPGASAGDQLTPPGVTMSGGAQDLAGNPVESRTYVGDDVPDDLGESECQAVVSVDGTVVDQQGDCPGIKATD